MKYSYLILPALLFISACSEQASTSASIEKAEVQEPVPRTMDLVQINRGWKLYQKNCAVCHGKDGEGAPDWRKMDENGQLPPPPLNGTGHTWHHPTRVLVMTIKEGTAKLGGRMPAWKDRLADQDIADILAWIQAQWPDEIYAAWYENELQSRKK